MEFKIPYGKKKIVVDIPKNNIQSLLTNKEENKQISEEDSIVLHALDHPIDSDHLSKLAYKKKNVCILVSDITRPCPSCKFLPHLLRELKKADVGSIKIVFGLGIHRKHTEEEKLKLVGKECAADCALIDLDRNRCRYIGKTSFGTPVEVFEDVADSDFIIATGNIEYHYFAGYSAGAKALLPGVCSKKSISANHLMMLDENAAAGVFHRNPVREDIEEAGKIAKIDFIFNVILDDTKRIIAAVAGKNNSAFLEGIKQYDSIYEIKVRDKADIVITSPGGYPKDINLYQAQKALDNVKGIVKDHGTIILVAECPEGFGEEIFCDWMRDVKNYDILYSRIKKEFVLGGHKAVAISKLLNHVKIISYVDIGKDKYDISHSEKSNPVRDFGFEKIDDLQSFLDSEIKKNIDIKITIVPNGRFIKLDQ